MSERHFSPFETHLGELDTFAAGPPHELFARMREQAPVMWTSAPSAWPEIDQPGFWSVTRAEHVTQVSKDPSTYSSWLGGFSMRSDEVGSLEVARSVMIGKDGAEHARMRGTVSAAFTPWRVRSLTGTTEDRVRGLIEVALEQRETDLVTAIAAPLANATMSDLLGVPEADREQLNRWTDAFLSGDDELAGGISGEEAMASVGQYLFGLLQERQEHPAEDLITALGQATYQGERMPVEDQIGVFAQLFAAGIDSTKSTVVNGVLTLVEHPDQLELLRNEPTRAAAAVEEILRWTPPFTHQRRTAALDTELGGQRIARGESVVMWLSSSSRDPRAIERADVFDITRGEGRCPHHAFGGGGRHFCIGAGLARLELVTFFETFARSVGHVEITAAPQRIRSCFVDGYKSAPVAVAPVHRPTPVEV